ncbi:MULTISPECIES: lytic transglycosylase domain-containing protein [unclassified Cyanobium]|uniref:lytic transglycosylase domain-containing protein n=1 Tax=unclassified Cyanobium TaxID=2627006 RepID=UPI0020CF3ADF|nr:MULTISPECIES: lytic transglycosylase domain-containing protein [unclassified Cyanobium]MCP9834159.1 lytic transglycosylase domain-containing protein [Cyanobium sp. La Preciosa 7G6]MCP9936922.1 lytic transglycosylase domain-containing protein [Cyanobium sp. Aljojuca 7A6]
MARLPLLLSLSCLGTALALVGGRALLARQPALTPATATDRLEWLQRWDADPWRRREASLLLAARSKEPQEQRQWLRGQGWGPDPLAALVLKQDALAAAAIGRPDTSLVLWRQLQRRFPGDPASADALYALGGDDPAKRRQLLQRFPAHPAALAAALAAGPEAAERRRGALHLAHWGARWPGAEARLRQVCKDDASVLEARQRAQLAEGLAELGDAQGALRCLGPTLTGLGTSGRLSLGRALLAGDTRQQGEAERLLLDLVRSVPTAPEAEAAVRLLAQQGSPAAAAALARLPPRWRESAPVLARRILEAKATDAAALDLLRRWPLDPASRTLQWDLVRERLLAGRWQAAMALLEAIPTDQLPPPLAARQSFWIGFVQQKLGQDSAARSTWEVLLRRHPGGYYGWRAAVRLGQGDLQLNAASQVPAGANRPGDGSDWRPLASGNGTLDRLWRLDQRTEAWETWRHRRGRRAPSGSRELLLEGRLRQGVGDDWTAFGLLEQASLKLDGNQCALERELERNLHPLRFEAAFRAAATQAGLPMALLLGVAKQESRFTPAVRSPVGATGLMQLMPATAAELAGGPVPEQGLEDPAENAGLGARYLAQMLRQWNGDPLLAVASYNAGPGAVGGWLGPQLRSDPELWVEAIPYPETRLYVKKVLGNVWSYQQGSEPGC